MSYSNEGGSQGRIALSACIEKTSEKDLRLAAEAIVDAAIWRQRIRADLWGQRGDVAEITRNALIDLIYRDPSQTAYLFEDAAWDRH